jgi:periplasmic divalent cation tolerance protein
MPNDAVLVMITCSSDKEADRIADMLVDKKLSACASVMSGYRSKFRWKGRVEEQKEILIMAKTSRSKFAAVDKEVRRLHSYEVPEIIAVPIIEGSKNYLKWIADSLK